MAQYPLLFPRYQSIHLPKLVLVSQNEQLVWYVELCRPTNNITYGIYARGNGNTKKLEISQKHFVVKLHTRTRTHARTHTHAHAHTRTRTRTRTRTHTHTHIYVTWVKAGFQ